MDARTSLRQCTSLKPARALPIKMTHAAISSPLACAWLVALRIAAVASKTGVYPWLSIEEAVAGRVCRRRADSHSSGRPARRKPTSTVFSPSATARGLP